MMNFKDYPFGKRKYIIPSSKNIQKALSLEEIVKIYNYETEPGSVKDMCRDYWIFIYLCNGLNVKDFCLLTYKDIVGDFIIFNRAKTNRSGRSNPEPIRIALKEDSKRIIAKRGQHEFSPDTYIFPYLKIGMTPKKQDDTMDLLLHLINDHIKQIAIELEIHKPITTYYARHSFATILKNSGVSREFISEALGHTSLETTKNYLAGFEQDAIRKATDVLISFKGNLRIA
jgi:integrase/recombinase XerD